MWIQSVPPSSFILSPYSSLPTLYNGTEVLLQLNIHPPLTLPAQVHCLHIFLLSELSWTRHGGAQLKSSEIHFSLSLYHLPATPCSHLIPSSCRQTKMARLISSVRRYKGELRWVGNRETGKIMPFKSTIWAFYKHFHICTVAPLTLTLSSTSLFNSSLMEQFLNEPQNK